MDTPFELRAANGLIDAALAHARTQGLAPMTVAVLDAGGHLVAFQREDGAGILRPQIAIGKAWGALGMGAGSRHLAQRAATHPAFVMALSAASEGRAIPVAGGVLIRDASGRVLAAVGISGASPDEDEACALKGIACAGWTADTGAIGH